MINSFRLIVVSSLAVVGATFIASIIALIFARKMAEKEEKI